MMLGPMDAHLYNSVECSDHQPEWPSSCFAVDIYVPVKFHSIDYLVNDLFNTIIMGWIWCWARWIHT
jgi:hypothetical protein